MTKCDDAKYFVMKDSFFLISKDYYVMIIYCNFFISRKIKEKCFIFVYLLIHKHFFTIRNKSLQYINLFYFLLY